MSSGSRLRLVLVCVARSLHACGGCHTLLRITASPLSCAPACLQTPAACHFAQLLHNSAMPTILQELSNELCGSPESRAAALLSAFEAGGAQAQAAVAIMLGKGSCLKPAAINAALSAFGDSPELNDPELVMR